MTSVSTLLGTIRWASVGALIGWELVAQPGFGSVQQTLCGLLFLVLGVSHGAWDRWLSLQWDTPPSPFNFYRTYLGCLAMGAIGWWIAPQLSLFGFLGASAYHFGEGEVRSLHLSKASWLPAWIGALVVGLPLVSHPSEVLPVIEEMGVTATPWSPTVAAWVSIGIMTGSIGRLWYETSMPTVERYHMSLKLLGWSLMFWVLHPLFAFALYFSLWHSIGHFRSLCGSRSVMDWLRAHLNERSLQTAAIYAVMSIGAMVVIANFVSSADMEASTGAVLVAVSILTVPHLVVVERSRELRS